VSSYPAAAASAFRAAPHVLCGVRAEWRASHPQLICLPHADSCCMRAPIRNNVIAYIHGGPWDNHFPNCSLTRRRNYCIELRSNQACSASPPLVTRGFTLPGHFSSGVLVLYFVRQNTRAPQFSRHCPESGLPRGGVDCTFSHASNRRYSLPASMCTPNEQRRRRSQTLSTVQQHQVSHIRCHFSVWLARDARWPR
jgi:hypothetical protein